MNSSSRSARPVTVTGTRARDGHAHLAFATEAGRALAGTAEPVAALAQVLATATPGLADWCLGWLIAEDGGLKRIEPPGADPAQLELLYELLWCWSPSGVGPRLVPHVLETGRPELLRQVAPAGLEALARTWGTLPLLRAMHPGALAVAPIVAGNRPAGALALVSADAMLRPLGSAELAVLEHVARVAGLALEASRQRARAARAEEQRLEAEERWRAVAETTLDGILSLDADLRIVDLDGPALSLFGRAREALIGQPLEAFVPGAASSAPGRRALLALRRPDQAEVPVELVLVPSGTRQRAEFTATLLARGAEEAHRAEEAVEHRVAERTAALEAENRELESFSYSVSHDLRAPLRHIKGYAELIENEAHDRLDERTRTWLRIIAHSAERGGRLIDDLLAFSRAGRDSLRRAPVDVAAMVAQEIAELKPESGNREVRWQVAPLDPVRADPTMLRVVFANLLSNALKYTGTRARATIEVGSRREGDEIVFFVRDNGVGFDMRQAGRLFGAFQRLHAGAAFEGSGVGLANVRRIVQRHGGRVWAEGAVERGATFSFSLPASAA